MAPAHGGTSLTTGGPPGTPAPERASAGWPDRSFAIAGVVVAGAVAAWWLGSSRLALDHGTDAGRSADLALSALWLVRGIAVAVIGIRAGALYGWRPAVHAGARADRALVARRGACMVRRHRVGDARRADGAFAARCERCAPGGWIPAKAAAAPRWSSRSSWEPPAGPPSRRHCGSRPQPRGCRCRAELSMPDSALQSLMAAVRRRIWRSEFLGAARLGLWSTGATMLLAAALHVASSPVRTAIVLLS